MTRATVIPQSPDGPPDTCSAPGRPGRPNPSPTPVDNGPAAMAARMAFDSGVYPIISAAGRCVSCHSAAGTSGNDTGFVGTTAENGYDTAVGYVALVGDLTPAGAPILAKIAGGHEGQSYTDNEKSLITTWLSAELTKRSSGGGTGGGTGGPPTGESPGAATTRL